MNTNEQQDRRHAERRTEQDDMPNGNQERSGKDRRVSPAVGEYAIQELAKLRAEKAELLEALKRLSASCDGTNLGTTQAPEWAILCVAETVIAKAESCAS